MVLLSAISFAQDSSSVPVFDSPPGVPEAISFFAPFVVPKILQDEYRLKEYICSDEFAAFRKEYGDVHATDAIFNRALILSWNNVYEALLISFVCTLEHRNFGVKLPVLGPLWIPLTSEFPDEFSQRVKALPSRLYEDTPAGGFGDRDKLQHFFGSAFIAYALESSDASERMGMFVEWGEDKFIVDGMLDRRDIRANEQGQAFATYLLNGENVLPSRFLGTSRRTLPTENSRTRTDSVGSSLEER
jgi:hypothetical protein